MKPLSFLLILITFFQFSCKQSIDVTQLEQLKTELEDSQKKLEKCKAELTFFESNKDYNIVHVVYFKLQKNIDHKAFLREIRMLKGIKVLKAFQLGSFKDLEDDRAMSEFDFVMRMGFKNEADYRTYQNHPLHLNLKKEVGKFLAGAPVTYDFALE